MKKEYIDYQFEYEIVADAGRNSKFKNDSISCAVVNGQSSIVEITYKKDLKPDIAEAYGLLLGIYKVVKDNIDKKNTTIRVLLKSDNSNALNAIHKLFQTINNDYKYYIPFNKNIHDYFEELNKINFVGLNIRGGLKSYYDNGNKIEIYIKKIKRNNVAHNTIKKFKKNYVKKVT